MTDDGGESVIVIRYSLAKGKGQRAKGRGQRTEDRGQRTDDR